MSINLTATNQSLEVVTTAAVQTQVVVSARDRAAGADTPISQDTNVTTATTTTIAAAPAASTQRQTDDVEILIVGAGQQGVKVQKNVGGTVFALLNVSLQTNERAHFTNDMGWRLFDALGREKNSVGYSLLKAPTLITSGTTYAPSIGCTAILMELWGGGGAGGGAANPTAAQATCGSGGSAGGYCRKFVIGVPSSLTIAIGAAGAGVSGAAGGSGGNTTCTTLSLVATGGTGGTTLATGTAIGETVAPAAVSGTGGDENVVQPSGANGIRLSATQAFGGEGGDSPMGNNGARRITQGAGAAASGIAGGGGGAVAYNAGGAQTGGAGAAGGIRVWEFTG